MLSELVVVVGDIDELEEKCEKRFGLLLPASWIGLDTCSSAEGMMMDGGAWFDCVILSFTSSGLCGVFFSMSGRESSTRGWLDVSGGGEDVSLTLARLLRLSGEDDSLPPLLLLVDPIRFSSFSCVIIHIVGCMDMDMGMGMDMDVADVPPRIMGPPMPHNPTPKLINVNVHMGMAIQSKICA